MSFLLRVHPPRSVETPDYSVLLVCSSGGHLAQLMRLKGWWSEHPRRWVSFDKPDVRSSLDGEELDFGHHPTTRNVGNLIRNLILAVRLLRRHRPDLVVSNGAGLAVAFFWIGWLMRIPSVWIEVYDRIDSATMTGRLVAPVSSAICVQWPEQLDLYPNATLVGPVW